VDADGLPGSPLRLTAPTDAGARPADGRRDVADRGRRVGVRRPQRGIHAQRRRQLDGEADDRSAIEWTRDFVAEAAQLPSARGIYLNFSGDEEIGGDLRSAAFGTNLTRLNPGEGPLRHRRIPRCPCRISRTSRAILPAVPRPGTGSGTTLR